MQRSIYNTLKHTLWRHDQHFSIIVNLFIFGNPPLNIAKVRLVLLIGIGISESDVKSFADWDIDYHAEIDVGFGSDLEVNWGGVALP